MAKKAQTETAVAEPVEDFGEMTSTHKVKESLVRHAVAAYYRKHGMDVGPDAVQWAQTIDESEPILTVEAPWQPLKLRKRAPRGSKSNGTA